MGFCDNAWVSMKKKKSGGWRDGWMNGWMDGWVDGQVGGWMGGWIMGGSKSRFKDAYSNQKLKLYFEKLPGKNIVVLQ